MQIVGSLTFAQVATMQPANAATFACNAGKDGAAGTLSGTYNTYYAPTFNLAVNATSIPIGTNTAPDTAGGGSSTKIAAGDLLTYSQTTPALHTAANYAAVDANHNRDLGGRGATAVATGTRALMGGGAGSYDGVVTPTNNNDFTAAGIPLDNAVGNTGNTSAIAGSPIGGTFTLGTAPTIAVPTPASGVGSATFSTSPPTTKFQVTSGGTSFNLYPPNFPNQTSQGSITFAVVVK